MKEDLEVLINRLERKFKRDEEIANNLCKEHKGKETSIYNYYAGEKLGWYAGYASALDFVLEELNIVLEVNKDE